MKRGKLIPISLGACSPDEQTPNDSLIRQQLSKIIAHRVFSGSPILCRFLCYIVNETLAGNAGKIKEYNIARYVLNKPAQFEVKKDGIVRIHACRLRQALANYYYENENEEKPVYISIPKGRYVAVFQSSRLIPAGPADNLRYIQSTKNSEKLVMAVMPFHTYENNSSRVAFTDSLGQRLSVVLNKIPRISIISYQTCKAGRPGKPKADELASKFNVRYTFAGDVHFEGDSILIFARLTDMLTQHQVWSDIYFLENAGSGYFEIAVLISNKMISALNQFVSKMNHPVSGVNFSEITLPNPKIKLYKTKI